MAAGNAGVLQANDSDKRTDKSGKTNAAGVDILRLIKEAHLQHGLRHGDYQRYRSYCARRIRRIRKSLHFPQGNKYKVQHKKITEDMLKDSRYLCLPLMESERAWSYAMQLKSEANTEPRKKFHMISRLKKAVSHADDLEKLCKSGRVDARTKLEAQAYSSWMQGTLYFEQENWKLCMELFTKAKTIYEKLSTAFTEDLQVLYKQRVEEIAPNIRYCAYNIGDKSAIDDLMQMRLKSGKEDLLTSQIDDLLTQTREKQTATLSEVSWRGHQIPVKNEKVRLFLLSVQASEKEIKEATTIDSKISVYESMFKECIDALQALRDELKNDPNFKIAQKGQKIEGQVSKLQMLHTYVTYLRLTKTIERNLLMIQNLEEGLHSKKQQREGKKIPKPQDLARLYEIIVQNLTDIPNLPGFEDDDSIQTEVDTEILGYKAFRCFYIAKTYASVKKWPEALALYERVLKYANQSLAGYKSFKDSKSEKVTIAVTKLNKLVQTVDGLKYSCHAASILDVDNLTEQTASMSIQSKKPLIDRLDEYVTDSSLTGKKPNLVPFPPDFQPIACKPLFFDLALNHLEFPSLDDKVEQKRGGGITGFVKGWLWGSKK
ncbi:signal recognition particle subunit SRP68-like [Tubulanus polymorphus]|uniref:signal recognition particle subunit SRP68-like n=1 Tax=Tubulanus polymorphus TaxID=672921 RepID=UPI003DA4364F